MDIVQDNPTKQPSSVEVLPQLLQRLKRDTHFLTEKDLNLVCERLQERSDFGKEKYGSRLHTFNGRDCELDAQQEIIDCIQYISQLKLEDNSLSEETITLWKTLSMLMNEMIEDSTS